MGFLIFIFKMQMVHQLRQYCLFLIFVLPSLFPFAFLSFAWFLRVLCPFRLSAYFVSTSFPSLSGVSFLHYPYFSSLSLPSLFCIYLMRLGPLFQPPLLKAISDIGTMRPMISSRFPLILI